jgi:hypothetical protein
MPPSSFSFSWSRGSGPASDVPPSLEDEPGARGRDPFVAAKRLGERLNEVAADRSASARALVAETTEILLAWVLERPATWSWAEAGRELESALSLWHAEQGWRGPCAVWIDSLRRAWHQGSEAPPAGDLPGPTAWFAEELGLWIWGRDGGLEREPEFAEPWQGEPLGRGRRVPSRDALATHAARELEHGELVLVSGGYSESLVLALQAAQRAGRRPAVWIAEGAPDLGGRRMARELSRAGLEVELGFDLAAFEVLPRADRLWLGTEAIGAEAFLARIGTRALIETAERLEVPVEVLATSDKLVPGGVLRLPAGYARETWRLWDAAPEGVRLQSQIYETVALDHVACWRTEQGDESASALHLRALRIEAAQPCPGTFGCEDSPGDGEDWIAPSSPASARRTEDAGRETADPRTAHEDATDPARPRSTIERA